MQQSPVRLFRGGDRTGRLKGRPVDETALEEVRALLGPGPHARDLLIEHLHVLNDHWHGLHERHLAALAREMNLPMAEVFEVASFYHHFDILRAGEEGAALTVRVCDGLPCEMAGARSLLDRLPALLGPSVRVVAAPCIGRCEQAPAALVGQEAVGQASVEKIAAFVGGSPQPGPPPEGEGTHPLPPPLGEGRGGGPRANPILYTAYRAQGGYRLATALARGERDPESILATLDHAGLRGLGGAGFPAARKWRIVREQPAPRLMAVNIDEGEPGTFKDRHYLERDPHRFLEGMLVAARVVGCDAVYIYLRDEYHACRQLLQAEIAALQADPPCPLPAIHLRRGAGAYICGEESAMIESIEGKRGEPRLRPPYIAQLGLFGRPTLEHNFETLYWVRELVERGPDWFARQGRHGRQGLRSFSVSGRVREPGVKLAPAGITLRELIDEYCGGMAEGHTLYGYLPGGASGGILPAALADVPLDFDTLQPHGAFIGSAAVIVLGHHDRARDAALNMMRFFAHESCGQCTPCRVGTAKAAVLMEAPQWDDATLGDLAEVMAEASICGLGQAAPNPIRCVQRYFPHEIA
ncbi:NADH-ubiquinone oxidoreductase-F iron-sulfur binding region domain-containing protein [Ramlibacter rhizophilus]|uniref:NADH-quinone oxidoreductase subunit F n=1 Tax=Ramlibacter rhizophilus TaxID=1781167 RepID=A0A4Z0BQC4_9BURK|nr:NADH-ubiquinone oxidoreductase-F iron-sulfur binding region domain-containing protein [Ramlibacter rhizophilus]TFZ01516.1 NADH-quinone oxidoreductase subunit F [Ramlibacter rhizophilus]